MATLGESSQLKGNVIAEDVVIRGRLIGSVRALRVMLQSIAHVEGDLLHKSLAIEQGAYFEGKSSRSDASLLPSQEASADGAANKPLASPQSAEQLRNKPSSERFLSQYSRTLFA
jgi:cytoskeletal protein CcmA (bactofilin family)